VSEVVAYIPEVETQVMGFDINKLAKAVAMHETANCTTGIGPEYNNCFGIKNGNTAPCPQIGRSNFCVYQDPQESYEAFKTIWTRWYGELPNLEMATRWSGNDRAYNWRNNVLHFYKTL